MLNFLKQINKFFRDLLLDDVDKDYGRPLPYHRKFGSVKRQKEDIKQKLAKERHEQSRGI